MRLIDADAAVDDIMSRPPDVYTTAYIVEWIRRAPTVGGWISVKDRLPKVGVTCLVAFGDVGLTFSTLDASGKWHVVNGLPQPDYWMPLPEPPGGKRVHT